MPSHTFQNFEVDHMTLLVKPQLYPVAYILFRNIFGVTLADILYDKRKAWVPGGKEESMTFAVKVGNGGSTPKEMANTIFAVVQPTEPKGQPSHVLEMLDAHDAAAHWQHVALRTPDLVAFHEHAKARGVQFITPILRDETEDLIQVFSGEWFFPGIKPSGLFFEFVQRNPTPESIKMIEEHNRQSWFRDKTFLGLYGEKEKEYQTGKVTPFLDFALFEKISSLINGKQVYEITENDLKNADEIMLAHTAAK